MVHIRFVLVRPRNPVNIGSAARAMANFGFSDLAAVSPYEPIWREAVSAVGADGLLKQAKAFKTVEEAVGDCQLVLATTTARRRAVRQPVIATPELAGFLEGFRKSVDKVAVLFGSEKTGLPTRMLERSNYLVTIPTEPSCPSMNLAQAVAVCAYELSKLDRSRPAVAGPIDEQIGFRQRQQLIAQAVGMFGQVGYMEHLPSEQKTKFLWNLFNQWGIRKRHAALIHGLIRQVNRRFSN